MRKKKEIDHLKVLRDISKDMYGFDTSQLSWKEQQFVEAQTRRRWELEAMREKLNPSPRPVLSKAEELQERRLQALWGKFEKVTKGRSVKKLSNSDLEKQVKILRSIVKHSGV
ncbi:hypothetical protein ACFRCQ_07555 [Cytobacillus firmus]|uniref:hypothetical protein n=1 Tax=Cytobacillus firmus TaxID=1399 RepID=UPI0036B46AB8